MRTVRIAAAVAISAALVGGLTACNGKSADKGGDAAATAAAPAAPAKNMDPKAALLAAAVVMDKAGTAKVTMETTGASAGSGSGQMSWKAPQGLDITMKQEGQDVRVEIIDGVMYTGVPAAQQASVGGKKYMKIDPKAMSNAKGGGADAASGFTAMQQMINPAVWLGASAQTGQVSKVGEEQVDGAPTVHYQSVMPVEAMVNLMTGLTEEMKKQVTATLKQDGSTITYDIWLNAKAEVVQEKSKSVGGVGKGAAAGSGGVTTIKYSQLGAPVTIQAPPAAEVFDLASMMKG